MTTNQTTDVAIIGGGIAGSAAAYYLAEQGVKATIIEREGIGAMASGYNAGGLNPLEGHGWPQLRPLALQSFRLHQELWDALPGETGIDYHGRIASILKVALDESELPELRDTLATFNGAAEPGFSAEWLEREDALALEPRLSPDIIAGVRAVGNGALDGMELTQALAAAAAQKRGATVVSASAVGLRLGSGRVESVVLSDGEIGCGALLIAAGPWCRAAEPWLDIAIPVDPLKGQIVRLQPNGPGLDYELIGGGSSMYAKTDGLIWCGSTEEDAGFDLSLTDDARARILKMAVRLMPSLSDAAVVQQTACLRPLTPDWLPIVGQAPGWENAYIAAGGQKKGILLGPAMGKGIAEIIVSGETDICLDGCGAGRFAGVAA